MSTSQTDLKMDYKSKRYISSRVGKKKEIEIAEKEMPA